jgi:serine/threonine-protein kinase
VIQCAHCATPIPDDAKFCYSCGSQVSDAEGQARASQSMDSESFEHMEQLLKEDTKGEFEIHKMLGRGGMAVVYLATETHLRRKVAIKVLPPELTFGHGVDRFKREAQTAAALDHPHIIPVYRIASGKKLFWYAMKFLEGRSLEDLIKEKKHLSLDETIHILAQVAEALDYAHEHSVIHRDVKPANVMLDSHNRVIVTDFGIAKALTEQTLTASGSVVGTPYYMSPEQGVGKGVSARSDQYSLAVMAYRMLSGQVPFEGDSAIDILHKHVMEPPPMLYEVAPYVPVHVCRAIHQGLEKKQEDRFPSCIALVEAMGGQAPVGAATGGVTSGDAATVVLPGSHASLARSAALPTTQRPVQPPPRAAPPKPTPVSPARAPASPWKKVVVVLGLAVVAGGALGAWWLSRQRAALPGTAIAPRRDSVVSAVPAPAPVESIAPPAAQTTPQATAQTPAGGTPGGQTTQPAATPAKPGATPGRPAAQPQVTRPPAQQRSEPPAQKPAAQTTPVTTSNPPAAAEPTDLPSQPGMGLVIVMGAPQIHRLFVDGRQHLRPRIELPPGAHEIRVAAPNRPVFTTSVTVVAGQRTVITYGVQAGPPAAGQAQPPAAQPSGGSDLGILQMRINPWANVSINGESKGPRPVLVDTLIPGTHLLHFERPGFETKDTTVTLKPGDTLRLTIRMVPKP